MRRLSGVLVRRPAVDGRGTSAASSAVEFLGEALVRRRAVGGRERPRQQTRDGREENPQCGSSYMEYNNVKFIK